MDSAWSDNYVKSWTGAEDDAERLCVAVILASTLLTEILHSSGVGHNYWPGQSEPMGNQTIWGTKGCDFVLMIKTTFLYLMNERYPCLNSEICCSPFGRSQYWSDTQQVHPSGSCH